MSKVQAAREPQASIHNTLILSDSPESARRRLGDLEGAAHRAKASRAKPAFVYEDQRGYVLIDLTQDDPSQISYEYVVSSAYLKMMQRVIVLVSSEHDDPALSADQIDTLSALNNAEVELILCLEEGADDKLNESIRSRGSASVASQDYECSEVNWGQNEDDHDSLYQNLRDALAADVSETRLKGDPSSGRLSITHIFDGYRKYHTPGSRGGS